MNSPSTLVDELAQYFRGICFTTFPNLISIAVRVVNTMVSCRVGFGLGKNGSDQPTG